MQLSRSADVPGRQRVPITRLTRLTCLTRLTLHGLAQRVTTRRRLRLVREMDVRRGCARMEG